MRHYALVRVALSPGLGRRRAVPCFVYDGAPADELIDYACDLAGVRERDREAIYLVRMGSPVASDGVILGTWEGETMLLSKRA